jgi:hypothetical protein
MTDGEDETDLLSPQEIDDLEASEPEAKEVTYSGQDFDVSGLVRRVINEDILVPSFGHEDDRIDVEGFQRGFVWRKPQMDRFIESLLLGYPIPGIFLVKQTDNRYLVLDGQQRLSTLRSFVDGIYGGKVFSLDNVADRFKGLTYKDLSDDLRRKFDNTFIQAILVTSDGSSQALDAVYNIFERLNSGGTQLTPHEIRVALHAGPFIDSLEHLNRGASWRALYGKKSPRLRDQELVLRIVALFLAADDYSRPLKKFLNDFAADNRPTISPQLEATRETFELAAKIIEEAVGKSAFRLKGQQVNAALTESVMVGLMKRLESQAEAPDTASVSAAIDEIRVAADSSEAFTRSTADEEQVKTRLGAGTKAFSGI